MIFNQMKIIQYNQNIMEQNNQINLEISQKYILFPEINYPFIDFLINNPKTYKTALSLHINHEQINKVMNFNHKNIININKIARGNPKNRRNSDKSQIYYFYYEYVPYCLKELIQRKQRKESHNKLIQSIFTNNINKILNDVSEYLLQQNIQHLFDFDHIGVTSQGQIKIYVSPKLFFTEEKNISINNIIKSIETIGVWWDNHLNAYLLTKIRKSLKYKAANNSPRYERNHHQSSKEVSYNTTIEQKVHLLVNNSKKESSKKVNEIKIKQLNDQIMGIKKRLNEKRKHKESENLVQNRKDLQQNYFNPYESQRFTKNHGDHFDENVGFPMKETIQQNINCINIYTNNNSNKAIQNALLNKSKKMSSQHIYSFVFSPEVKKSNIILNNNQEFDDLRRSEEQEDIQSLDTYDMEDQIQVEPAKALNLIYNATGQRESSQRNFKSKHFQSALPLRNNQVSNNFATGSAGPIQMKKLFNTYLKPQFYPKKSNIYQDANEYESETSKSKSHKKYIKELYQTGKSVNSFHQSSSLYSKSKEEETLQQVPQRANNMMKKDMFAYNQNNGHQSLSKLRKNGIFTPIVEKEKKSEPQHSASYGLLNNKFPQKSEIQEVNARVNEILEKTRKAIDCLTKIKQNRKDLKSKLMTVL